MSETTKGDLTIREMAERAWRSVSYVPRFWFLTALATALVVLFWPRTYASTARIYLQKGRESVGLDPTANATGRTIALQQAGRESEIKSAVDVIGSRGILEPVVDQITPAVVMGNVAVGEGKTTALGDVIRNSIGWVVKTLRSIDPASDRERAILEIEKSLWIHVERKSEVISITFQADNPELAQLVVKTIVEKYQDKHLALHRTEGSTEFFYKQSNRLKMELQTKSEALRAAKDKMGLASVDVHRKILEEQFGEVRRDILNSEKALSSAHAKAANLAGQLRVRPKRISSAEVTKPNASADMQRQLLFALQIDLAEARAKFTGNHPQVRSLRELVSKAEAQLRTQVARRTESTDDANPIHEKLSLDFAENEAEIAGLSAEQSKLRVQEATLLIQIKDLNAFEVEEEQLAREVKVADKKYLTYAESLEEAQVDKAMQADRISSVHVAQAATLQEKPVAPSKSLAILVGAMISLVGAIAIAFIGIQFDDTLTSSKATRRQLDVPVLGTLPYGRKFSRVNI